MTYPQIAIGIITYNRAEAFAETLHSLLQYLRYPQERLFFFFSDDGSASDYAAQHVEKMRQQGYACSAEQHARLGMPGNWNHMIRTCETQADYVLCLQDDWRLTEPLDLRLGVAFLMDNPRYGMVRYHKTTGHTGLHHAIQEWDTRAVLTGFSFSDYEYAPYMLPYFDLQPNDSDIYSPYSGGVHLRHKRFTACYGEYTERIGFSECEFEFMQRVNHGLRHNPDVVSRIALFPHYVVSRFQDLTIGSSYRGTTVERETMR